MSEQSTIHYERTSPQIAKITFANPPVNLIAGETVLRLIEIVEELATAPDIQVVLFDSATPDFFYNHFDLAAAADFPAPDDPEVVPAGRIWSWNSPGRRTSPSRPSGDAPAAAGTSSPSPSICATPVARRRSSDSPRSAADCCPAVAAPNACPAPSDATAPWKPSSPATTTTPTPPSVGAG